MTEDSLAQKPFPQTRWAIAWIIAFFLVQIICGLVAVKLFFPELQGLGALFVRLADLRQSGLANLYGSGASGLIVSLLLFWYFSRRDRIAVVGLDRWSALSFGKTVGIGFLLLFGAMAITFVYSNYVVHGTELQQQTRDMIASVPKDPLNQLILYLSIAVFPAIVEEVIFRGLLQNGLKRRIGPAFAIVLSGLIFGIVHGQPAALPILAVLGMAFGLLYHITGSLRVNIALHLINNAAALLLG